MKTLLGIVLIIFWAKYIGEKRAARRTDRQILLRLELNRLKASGAMSEADHAHLAGKIDTLWFRQVSATLPSPIEQSRHQWRETAWRELAAALPDSPLGAPPWRGETEPTAPAPSRTISRPADRPKPAVRAKRLEPSPSPAIPQNRAAARTSDSSRIAKPSRKKRTDGGMGFAWKPRRPAALEQAMRKASRLPRRLLPFLAQNVGWFISGFSFIAGSLFLIGYTGGFTRALIIASSLFLYTFLILGGAYKLLVRRPDLRTACTILFSLGMLLIPISIAGSVRLADIGFPDPLPTAVGGLLLAVNLAAFFHMAQLASGIMDRTLQGAYVRLFVAISSVQLLAPIAARSPSWVPAALLHLLLLGLLAYGARRFTNDWLKSIFLDRGKAAFYAAGTLVFAAAVSFVHVTWRHPLPFPDGYAGPFLMALSGILFFIDSRFKTWTRQFPFLSRFTFAVYGLSALSMAAAWPAPIPRAVTLALGTGIYAAMVRQYLTLVPLLLSAACAAGLYGLLILKPMDPALHLIAALPGLVGLFAVHRWALSRKALALARGGLGACAAFGYALAVWSLAHAGPGPVAALTGLLTATLTHLALGRIPAGLITGLVNGSTKGFMVENLPTTPDLRGSAWCCLVPFWGTVTLAFLPILTAFGRMPQISIGMLLLAGLWIASGLRRSRRAASTYPPTHLVNCGLVSIALGLAAIWIAPPWMLPAHSGTLALFRITTSGLAAALLFGAGLGIGSRPLFYGGLLLSLVACALTKQTYFPGLSPGFLEVAAAWGLAVSTWRMSLAESVRSDLGRKTISPGFKEGEIHIFWRFPVHPHSPLETALTPLTQAMVGLWAYASIRATLFPAIHRPTPAWLLALLLGTGLAACLILRHGRFRLWPGAVLMGLLAAMGSAYLLFGPRPWFFLAAAAIYGTGTWMAVRRASASDTVRRLASAIMTGRTPLPAGGTGIEGATFRTAHGIILATVAGAVGLWVIRPDLAILPALGVSALFFALGARIRRDPLLVHELLAAVLLSILVLHVQLFEIVPPARLFLDPSTGTVLALLSLAYGLAGWKIFQRKRHNLAEAFDDAEHLYRTPLLDQASALSLAAAAQQVCLAVTAPALGPILVLNLFLSAAGLLLSARARFGRTLAGVAAAYLGLLGFGGVLLHPEMALTSMADTPSFWLWAAGLSLGGALLDRGMARRPGWQTRFAAPVWVGTAGLFTLSLIRGVGIFGTILTVGPEIGPNLSIFPPLGFLLLAAALAVLARPLPRAAEIRGAGVGLLVHGAAVAILLRFGPAVFFPWIAWPFLLWFVGSSGLPRFNERTPAWAVSPGIWPWMGLAALILADPIRLGAPPPMGSWPFWLTLSAYLFLMTRDIPWQSLAGLAVSAAVMSGLCGAVRHTGQVAGGTPALLILLVALLGDLLLGAAVLWRRWLRSASGRWGWRNIDMEKPLLSHGWAMFTAAGCVTAAWTAALALNAGAASVPEPALVWAAIFLVPSLYLLHRQRPSAVTAHATLAALPVAMGAVVLRWSPPGFGVPLVFALWSLALLGIDIRGPKDRSNPLLASISPAVGAWTAIFPFLTLAALVALPVGSFGETVAVLALSALAFTAVGRWRGDRRWAWGGVVLFLILLHTWPMAVVPSKAAPGIRLYQVWPLIAAKMDQIRTLLPWLTLQLGLCLWGLIGLGARFQKTAPPWGLPASPIRLKPVTYLVFALALTEWTLHGIDLWVRLMGTGAAGFTVHGAAALASMIMLILLAGVEAARTRSSGWVYGTAGMVFAFGAYLRLLMFGPIPPMLLDTAALLGAGYALHLVRYFGKWRSIENPVGTITLALPIVALVTIPWHLGSPHAAAALLSAGLLYLSMYRSGAGGWLLYPAVLLINGSIYLWIPLWAERLHLVQLYVIPGALSVLALLHLHRRTLNRSVLNTTRLAATCALYAAATADLFLRPELTVFILMVGLSMAGISAGITLRIRAFLYGATAFLVLNVTAQLVRYYPEQAVAKGVLLLAVGAVLMAGMVAFNIWREEILKRVRFFRADLEGWA